MHFLCKVVNQQETNSFKVLVNLDNMNELPVGNVGEKLVSCTHPLKSGDVIYAYDCDYDATKKKVTVKSYTVISSTQKSGVDIPSDMLSLANLSEITPYDLLEEIYAVEEEEDEDAEDSELQDVEES